VHPVILGTGKRLFTDDTSKEELKLIDTKTFSKGIVVLEYERA
jgi:dihydrofolate reductase